MRDWPEEVGELRIRVRHYRSSWRGNGQIRSTSPEGSFSAVSKPNFARKYAFESSRRIATSSTYFTPAILAPRSRLSRRLRAACRCRGLSRSSACGAGLLSNPASCTFAAEPPRHSIPPVRRARRASASRTDREDRPLCLFGRLRGSCAAGAVLLSCPASRTSAKTLPRNRVVPVRPAKARRASRASVSLS